MAERQKKEKLINKQRNTSFTMRAREQQTKLIFTELQNIVMVLPKSWSMRDGHQSDTQRLRISVHLPCDHDQTKIISS